MTRLKSRPLEIWKGPKSYTRWDGKTGWIWCCWICREESEPLNGLAVAYKTAVNHLLIDHLGTNNDSQQAETERDPGTDISQEG